MRNLNGLSYAERTTCNNNVSKLAVPSDVEVHIKRYIRKILYSSAGGVLRRRIMHFETLMNSESYKIITNTNEKIRNAIK